MISNNKIIYYALHKILFNGYNFLPVIRMETLDKHRSCTGRRKDGLQLAGSSGYPTRFRTNPRKREGTFPVVDRTWILHYAFLLNIVYISLCINILYNYILIKQ